MPSYVSFVEDERFSRPLPKKRGWFGSQRVDVAVVASVVLLGTTIKIAFSLAGSGSPVNIEHSERLPMLAIYGVARAAEVPPAQYDSSNEIRVPVAERLADGRLKPFVVVLRGPWSFGSAEIESVALALGPPTRRGAGYLIYDLEGGKIRLNALFNAGRLDTLVVSPNPCPPDAPNCDHPYAWGLTKAQKESEELQYEPPPAPDQPCGTLAVSSRGLYYTACPVQGRPDEPSVSAVYIQRVTTLVRNPPAARGLAAPWRLPREAAQKGVTGTDYDRLLAIYRESLRFKQKALGPEHSSVQFLRFELGRMQVEAGQTTEGLFEMQAAMEKLSKALPSDHPDLAAMRLWVASAHTLSQR